MTVRDREHLRFYDKNVVKQGDPTLLAIEAAKTRSAHQISMELGCFRVPRVIEFDSAAGELVLEKIEGVTLNRLPNEVAYGKRRIHTGRRIGSVLATVHKQLSVSCDVIPLTESVAWDNESVTIHGDFSLHNVSLLPNGEIALFDWQTTRVHGGMATHGTYFFDVAWFMLNLFLIRCTGLRYSPSLPMASVARNFAQAYFEESGRPSTGFREYVGKVFGSTLSELRKGMTGRNRFYLACVAPFSTLFAARSTKFS